MVVAAFLAPSAAAVAQPFDWDNAIIYFVMTDRFANGDPENDHAYGRGLDLDGTPVHANSPARFRGGDLAGLIGKVRDGYFSELGVNALWMTSPLEQVRGWVGGAGGEYPAYAYHGYWPLDFTRVDSAFGTESDLRELVTVCHERGIRVLMDVVINHAGYNTLADMDELGFGGLSREDWRGWSPAPGGNWNDYHDLFIDYTDASAWSSWWGGDWMRANIAGYPPCGESDRTTCTSSLPDFRTESDDRVATPDFLRRKWRAEHRDLSPADSTPDIDYPKAAVREHITGWLAAWVRDIGIDGFRLDTVKNLDPVTMRLLKTRAAAALRAWKNDHPLESLDSSEFWMMGEVFDHGVYRSEYFDAGLDAVLNFDFQRDLARGAALDSIFSAYADAMRTDPSLRIVSYVSSHDTYLFDRERLFEAATALMLVPGGVQIFYGDESARPAAPPPASGPELTRSGMNWDSADDVLLSHWQRLGQFRSRHPAIARGAHEVLARQPYTFSRTYGIGEAMDRVVVVLGSAGRTSVNVSKVFGDNTILKDAYSGKTTFVSYGMVNVDAGANGVVLLEEVQ